MHSIPSIKVCYEIILGFIERMEFTILSNEFSDHVQENF